MHANEVLVSYAAYLPAASLSAITAPGGKGISNPQTFSACFVRACVPCVCVQAEENMERSYDLLLTILPRSFANKLNDHMKEGEMRGGRQEGNKGIGGRGEGAKGGRWREENFG